jgi:3',5'-cyclic AMP phosphodiesterase CpdA
MKITRSKFIALAIIFLFLCSCKSEFSFIQVSDPQFGFISDNKGYAEETSLYEKAVEKINELRPVFVVITGDLVNNRTNKAQWDEFRRITSKIKPRVYIVPGNHDLGHELTEADLKEFDEMFGTDRFAIGYRKSRFIGINSNLIKSEVPVLENEQLQWLQQQLAAAKGSDHILIFCHHPFFIKDPAEPEQYFNIKPETRARYLALFEQSGVDAIFAGHLHKNAEASYDNILMITTSSIGKQLGSDKPGVRLVTIKKDKIEHKYIPVEE